MSEYTPGKMNHFPLVVADDFYEDPLKVRDFALQLEYQKCADGSWPGRRTASLKYINPAFHMFSCSRFMKLFFELDFSKSTKWDIDSYFQIIDSVETEQSVLNNAWIHLDGMTAAAGVLYLTPEPNRNSGTTIFKLKNENQTLDHLNELDIITNKRKKYFITGIADDEYKTAIKEYNSNFEEDIIVKNKFNRIIAYDGNMYHSASTHFNALDEARFTQVFFLNSLETDCKSPLDRMKL
jgi:hypothetical protein